ncbi:unnamed protein product [Callosobruchus maculatus]|uniref:Uncharacterized protein n=1 Tax=Callosobruchus maculatus TaxID=64391 RepID=A0A653D172_CALMS|nr:unnamed protein product [Callosobruchus maculatus]
MVPVSLRLSTKNMAARSSIGTCRR